MMTIILLSEAMRYKPEQKEETHRRIVATASREFRTHGFESVGIAKLMGVLELTHGGFYAHFDDKENLVTESAVFALNESLEAMLAVLQEGGIPMLLGYYLSEAHRDHPECGCPLPSVTAEVARRPSASRERFTNKLSEVFDTLAEHLPGSTPAQRQAKVRVMFASMSGAIALARAVTDPVLSQAILESTREYLLSLMTND